MAIQKGSFTFTFLFDDEVNSKFDVQGMSIDELLTQCDVANIIGELSEIEYVEIEPEAVKEELEELGNDGTFFDKDESGAVYHASDSED